MANPYFQINIWDSDLKQTKLNTAPITSFTGFSGSLMLNAPYEYTVTLLLQDALAQSLYKTNYCEISVGYTSPQIFASGYIQDVVKSDGGQQEFQLTIHSSLLFLAQHINTGQMEMPFPTYRNVMDVLNGVHQTGQPAIPGEKGILDGTGWVAVWVGDAPVPGLGDSWRQDWATSLLNIETLAVKYGLFFRERLGSRAHAGILEIGKLDDISNVTIIGGKPLEDFVGGKKNVPLGMNVPAAFAQETLDANMAIIEQAQWHQSTTSMFTACYGVGAGAEQTLVTIKNIFGDVALNDAAGTPVPGVTKWQPYPHGRVYYLRGNTRSTWQGHSERFQLYAVQQQERENEWAYGVLDWDQCQKYGVIEHFYEDKHAHQEDMLLAGMLGQLETNARPVDDWAFQVRFPLNDDNMVPPVILPGQKIDVQYAGQVEAVTWNDDTKTFQSAGTYQYLEWPNTTDQELIDRLKKVVQVDFQFDDTGYHASITLGKAKRDKHLDYSLEKKFERDTKALAHAGKKHKFVKWPIHQIPFWFFKTPGGHPNSWEDSDGVHMETGTIVVSNVPNDTFFDNHHHASFDVAITDPTQVVDFWFSKPSDGTVTSAACKPGSLYAFFRMAAKDSGQKTGFYTSQDGTPATTTHHGTEPHKGFFAKGKGLKLGTYRVEIVWSGNVFEANLTHVDPANPNNPGNHTLVATWHDYLKTITTGGAIGWHYWQGSPVLVINNVHASPFKKKSVTSSGGDGAGGTSKISSGPAHVTHKGKHIDPSGKSRTFQSMHSTGITAQNDAHYHGPFHPTSATVATISQFGVTFTTPIQANALKTGWIVSNQNDDSVKVTAVSLTNGAIAGFSTLDTIPFAVGDVLDWDPFEDDVPNAGHIRYGIYGNWLGSDGKNKSGWCIVDHPADAPSDGSKDLVYRPDGSSSLGATPLTQDNGTVVNLSDLAVTGAQLAIGLESSGELMFDSGEYSSKTQQCELFPSATNYIPTIITPNTTVTGGGNALYDQPPTKSPCSWVSHTGDQVSGIGDAILQLTTGPYNGTNFEYVYWFDSEILEEDGTTQRTYTVDSDVTFEIPIYVGASQTKTTLNAGMSLQFVSYSASGEGGRPTIYCNPIGGTFSHIQAGDTFSVGVGLQTAETVTVYSIDASQSALILTAALAHTHNNGETVLMTSTDGGATAVDSGGLMDGSGPQGVPASVNAVLVTYLADATMADGSTITSWFPVWWGDPSVKWPWMASTQYAAYIGPLTTTPGSWHKLQFTASQGFMYAHGKPAITIKGVGMAVYTADPTVGQTVYFDAHGHGFNGAARKVPTGSVGSQQIGSGSVGNTQLSNDAPGQHTFTDCYFWIAKNSFGNWALHWESGDLIVHDGTATDDLTINAGTSTDTHGNVVSAGYDYWNTGLHAVPRDDQTTDLLAANVDANVANNFLVFNTSTDGVWVADPGVPGGKSYIPGYAAVNPASSANGQSRGFAFVTNKVSWDTKTGGADTAQGVPAHVFLVGTVAKTPDGTSGIFQITGVNAIMKQGSDAISNEAISGNHLTPNLAGKFHLQDIKIDCQSSNATAQTCVVTWTAGTIVNDNGSGTTATITAGSWGGAGPGMYVVWDSVAGGSLLTVLPSTTDFTLSTNQKYYVLGKISNTVGSDGQYYLGGVVTGAIVSHGDSVAKNTITDTHIDPNHPITGASIALATITSSNIGTAAITSAQIQDGTITGTDIHAATIAGTHIQSATVTGTNIASLTITSGHIQDAQITSTKIGALAVQATHINDSQVISRTIAANNILSSHINANQILSGHINSNQILATHINDSQIVSRTIAANNILSSHINANQILSGHINSNQVLSAHINTNQINAGHIQNNAINANHINTAAVQSAHIGNLQVNSNHINNLAIQSGHINSLAINTNHINNLAIKAAHIDHLQINADHVTDFSLHGGEDGVHNHFALHSVYSKHRKYNVVQNWTVLYNNGVIAAPNCFPPVDSSHYWVGLPVEYTFAPAVDVHQWVGGHWRIAVGTGTLGPENSTDPNSSCTTTKTHSYHNPIVNGSQVTDSSGPSNMPYVCWRGDNLCGLIVNGVHLDVDAGYVRVVVQAIGAFNCPNATPIYPYIRWLGMDPA